MDMDSQHRNVLLSNRVAMIRAIQPTEELLSFLQSKKILNENMVEEIQGKATRHDRVGTLLNVLPRRGPHAFRACVEGLVESDQGPVADVLDKDMADRYRAETRRPREDTYPESAVMQPAVQRPTITKVDDSTPFITFSLKSVTQRDGLAKNKDKATYPMKMDPRGRAIIINIDKFSQETKHPDRVGSEFDVTNLAELFKNLHFDVKLHVNLTKEEFENEIEKERQDRYHKTSDAFIMVILSHGKQGKIISMDGHDIDIQAAIVNKFNGRNCVHLINKPKMFFIQACQGGETTSGVVADGGDPCESVVDLVQMEKEKAIAAQNAYDTKDSIDAKLRSITHEQADLFIAYATVPGYKAWRHTGLGSWFVRDLVTIFAEYCHVEHVADMIVRVNQLVDDRSVENSQFKQICRSDTQLKRKVFLLPGYFE